MGRQLVELEKTTPRKLIERERQRLIPLMKDDSWFNTKRSDWAKKLFGETFTEKTAEEVYEAKNGDVSYINDFNNGYCQICGENFKLDEEFVLMSFSFCDEYSCGMTIHKNCKKLRKL